MSTKRPVSIFTKIINHELPATIRYEDDECIVIDDIHPKAPVHVLLIPKEPFQTLEHVGMSDGHFHKILLQTARRVAKLIGIEKNYRLVLNVGADMQMVPHIHVHILGGWQKPPTDI